MINELLSGNIPAWLLPLNVSNLILLLAICRSYIENISRINLGHNLGHSLHFKPSLQCTVCSLYFVSRLHLQPSVQYAACSLHFILTD